MRQRRLTAVLGTALLPLLSTAGASAAANTNAEPSATPPPVYEVTPCCALCPQAADPDAYAGSSYLQEFRVLQQGRNGWLFRTQIDLATQFEISDPSVAELARLASAMRARGSELVIVLQPPRGLMDADQLGEELRAGYDIDTARRQFATALSRIRSAGVTVPPLDSLVDEHKGYEYFFRRDHHWTPAGAEATARLVADTIRAMPAFADVPRQRYRTRVSALIGKPGTLQKVASQICGGVYSMQYLTGYVTEPDTETGRGASAPADAAAALLGEAATQSGDGGLGLLDDGSGNDAGVPQIALVGTSNSDAKGGYNFGGYLQQHLGADLLNVALSGGSFDGSLLRYLPSPAYQQHPPKIVVWELPWHNWPGRDKNPYRTFRQALPLVHDGCRGRPATIERRVDLQAGENELLFNSGAQPLQGGRYWLDLQFSDPAIKDLLAMVWYYTGQKETLKLHFNSYVDNGGRFVTELRRNRADYARATLMGATLTLPSAPARPLSVDVRLCPMQGAADPQTADAAEVRHAASN